MSDLIPIDPNKIETSSLFDRVSQQIIAGLTGIASSKREELSLSLGHILQRIRSLRFLETLKKEWDFYVEKGRIKEDYTESEQHISCLQEMLDFLDKDAPDELRFSVLKKILLVASTEDITSRDSVLPQQYMQLSRQLTTGELLVLLSTYNIAKANKYPHKKNFGANTWLDFVAKHSGLEYLELVALHEFGLIKKQLLIDRLYPDRSGVEIGANFRLTSLGWEFCQYIDNYKLDENGDV